MFCGKCGAECKDGAKFCSKCGAPLKSNALTNGDFHSTADSENIPSSGGWFQQHKKRVLAILIVVIVAVIVIIAVSVSRHSSKQENTSDLSAKEHLELGIRYLGDGEYEEAVDEFTAVLDIESNNMFAYTYLADAYLDLDETGQAKSTFEKAIEVALNEYDINEALPENINPLYEEAVSFNASYGEVKGLDELENILDQSSEEPEATTTSEDTDGFEIHNPKKMYTEYYQKAQEYQDTYGAANIGENYDGSHFIDGVALIQLADLNADGQDELILIYNNLNQDDLSMTIDYTLEIWSYDWEKENNELKCIYNSWLGPQSDGYYDFEILKNDDKYWFAEGGDVTNIVDEGESIPEENWDNTNSENIADYPLSSYDSDFMDKLNGTISKSEDAMDALLSEINGSGEWQDLYKDYVSGYLESYSEELGAPVIYELDPESTYQFALIYLNDDDVPELLVEEERDNSQKSEDHTLYKIYNVRDGELKTVGQYSASSLDFSYMEHSSLYYVSYSNNGSTYDDLYQMVSGGTWGDDSETVYSLSYSSEDKSYYMNYGAQQTGSSTYNLSNTILSKKEYNEHKDKLREYLDDNNATTPSLHSQEEMLEQLQDY